MSTFGLDYAERARNLSQLKRFGAKFVCRYLSGFTSKDLSLAEARELTKAGLGIVVVWERDSGDARLGHDRGVADAKHAAQLAGSCGMPNDRPIYFAVDEDVDGSAVVPYFQGVKSVLGWRAGVYADANVCGYLLDHGLVGWAWQTYAWSGGRWEARAHLRQYSNGHNIGGLDCDFDSGVYADYGQWRIGWTPAEHNPYPVLMHGSRGADVARLSRNLHFLVDPEQNNTPYYAPGWRGPFPGLPFFTNGLVSSVKLFQFRSNLHRTGVMDLLTWKALGRAIYAQKHPTGK